MKASTIIPFGPQHPVLIEPLQLALKVEDERVVEVRPALGYTHRGLEKGAELNDVVRNIFMAERVCGICSFIHSWCYCACIEELLNVESPPRAEFIRLVSAELTRIHSHLLYLGLLADGLGFESLFMQFWRVRERVLDLMEAISGGRVIMGNCTIGGVRKDIDADMVRAIFKEVNEVERDLVPLTRAVLDDYTVKKRTVGKGVLSKEDAIKFGAVGPVARASGVKTDVRLLGEGPYKYVDFEVVIDKEGDAYARTAVHVREVFVSLDLIRQVLSKLPAGEIKTDWKGKVLGEVIKRMEQPRGEMMYYVRGNGNRKLERFKVRTPTFANIPPLLEMLPGCELADVPVIVISIDPCIACTER
ncbi:MAG TPA: nickel-dependent hydrogenase large subunit [Syntrophothermus lipocalidus]|nr:nickel-dependent hydrogenase large subunit [Syntrophothermus lipocalidus]